MEYEKKYNDALDWMRKVYPTLNGSAKEDAEHYFPELKETEDKRIRKEIIEFLTDGIWSETTIDKVKQSQRYAKWIAYLEKQKEQKIARWKPLEKCSDIPDGHYVVGWFRFGDFRLGVMFNALFVGLDGNRAEQPKEVFYIPNADEEFVYAKQQSAEWSEEDEERLDSIIESYKDLLKDYKACHDVDYIPYNSNTVIRNVVDDVNFLKSLRPQPHWKPSEEQMGTLKQWLQDHELDGDSRYVYPIFYSLLSDLQKLL